jgi:hypothetical protein
VKTVLSFILALVLGAASAGAQSADQMKAPTRGLDTIIDYHAIIEDGDADSGKTEPPPPPQIIPDSLRQSPKWWRMERIDEQGGERADLSRRTGPKTRFDPVLGHREQTGNPTKIDDDLDKKAVGVDLKFEF